MIFRMSNRRKATPSKLPASEETLLKSEQERGGDMLGVSLSPTESSVITEQSTQPVTKKQRLLVPKVEIPSSMGTLDESVETDSGIGINSGRRTSSPNSVPSPTATSSKSSISSGSVDVTGNVSSRENSSRQGGENSFPDILLSTKE